MAVIAIAIALTVTVDSALLRAIGVVVAGLAAAGMAWLMIRRGMAWLSPRLHIVMITALTALNMVNITTGVFMPPGPPEVTALTTSAPLETVNWVPFIWRALVYEEETLERGMLLVPVRLDDAVEPVYFELDSALSTTMLYRDESESPEGEVDYRTQYMQNARLTLTDGVTFTVSDLPVTPSFGRRAQPNAIDPAGAIGLDALIGRVLVIDYPNSRLAIVDALPSEWVDHPAFVPIEVTASGLRVPITTGNRQDHYEFTTGWGHVPLVMRPDTWAVMTEPPSGATRETDRIIALSDTGMTGALTTQPLSIGSAALPASRAYADPSILSGFDMAQHQVRGHLGHDLFREGIVIVDYIGSRFAYLG